MVANCNADCEQQQYLYCSCGYVLFSTPTVVTTFSFSSKIIEQQSVVTANTNTAVHLLTLNIHLIDDDWGWGYLAAVCEGRNQEEMKGGEPQISGENPDRSVGQQASRVCAPGASWRQACGLPLR